MSHRGTILLHRAACKKSFHANFFFISAFNRLQIILLELPWHKDSKYVLRFEIVPGEGGEKNWTNKQTNRQTNKRRNEQKTIKKRNYRSNEQAKD